MKVFISWSGSLSRKVAEILREWIPSVLQSVDPYVSSEDIDKGARWSSDIASELEGSNFGILCVTKDNLSAPWLNFEAGALSKLFETSRVSPFLFGVDRPDVTGPLLQFQSTVFEHDDILKLIRSINATSDAPLEPSRLEMVFEVWWPRLEERLKSTLTATVASTEAEDKRSVEDVLDEVLELVRSQQKLISRPEVLLPRDYLREIGLLASRVDVVDSREIEFLLHEVRRRLSVAEREPNKENFETIHELLRTLGIVLSSAFGVRLRSGRLRGAIKGRDGDVD
ncbi:hypothetical protein ACFPM7_26930 [Actinokineospora guangxiensis]|uniref:TIR domain-containing protein n=1 Tax=Actinokineospora guangxiensis TaxID=1490288 RepID=A0ABW0EYR5_9PSEU